MADDEKFRVSFTYDTGDSEGNLVRLQNVLAKLVIATEGEDKAIKDIVRSMADLSGASRTTTTNVGNITSALSRGKAAAKEFNDALRQSSSLARNFQNIPEQGNDTRRVGSSFGNILDVEDQKAQQASRSYHNLSNSIDDVIDARKRESSAFSDSLRARLEEQEATRKSILNYRQVGYELLVVGGIVATAGAGLLQFAGQALTAGIQYERAFANVIRTASDGTISISNLRRELIGLTTEIPETFQNITEIASLGGQLGIAGTGITQFTSVVARLTATTDLTAEAAGTALGRFQALLGLPSDKFENLASAILKVGVNSVATESQIVAISTQISSMADFAGFTADQVVGLAGALASVGAAPELSRGTITRTFSLISKAVSTSSEDLDKFARIAGVSSAEFSSAFGTARFAPLFQSFLSNLGKMQEEGDNVVVTLNDLGITSVRDVPLLLRLAGATDTVTKTFADAAQGFSEATELQEQYGIIASTTASRIQLLVNNVQNFLATIGGAATGPLSTFVDILSEVVKALTEFLSTPVGQNVALMSLAVTVLVGAVFSLAGVLSFASGTLLLATNAAKTLGLTIGGVSLEAKLATVSLSGMAAAAGGLLARLGPLLLALTAIGVVASNRAGIDEWSNDIMGISNNISDVYDRLKNPPPADALFFNSKGLKVLKDYNDALGNLSLNRSIGGFANNDFADIAAADEALAKQIEAGGIAQAKKQLDELRVAALKAGVSQEAFNAAFPDTVNALKGVTVEAFATSQAALDLAASEDAAATAAEELATQLGLTPDALKSLQDAIQEGSASFFGFGSIISELQKKQEDYARQTAKDSGDSADNWELYKDESVTSLQAFSDGLQAQIDAQQAWADNLQILSARGATGFVTELAKLGPAGAAVAEQAVNATSDELAKIEANAQLAAFLASEAFAQEFTTQTPKLIEAYRTGGIEAVKALIDAGVSQRQAVTDTAIVTGRTASAALVATANSYFNSNPLTPKANTQPAIDAVNGALNRIAQSVVTIGVNATPVTNSYRAGSVNRYAASGGFITGPGTGTSDSIPARLSNGEYVIRAASVRRYGTGLFDQLNRGVARFATGGSVGSARPTSTQVQLSPPDRAALRSGGSRTIQLVVDGRVLAEAVDNANNNNQFTGSN